MRKIHILLVIIGLSLTGVFAQHASALPQHQHQHTDKNKETKNKDSKQNLEPQTDKSSTTNENQQDQHKDHNSPNQQTQEQPTEQQSMPNNHIHPDPSQTQTSSNHQHTMDMNSITGGPFHNHLAIGSGTSILPASSPGYMWYFTPRDWTIMLHGEFKLGFNYQRKPRGVGKAESQNYLMLMASHKLVGGEFMFRTMLSAEPLTRISHKLVF